MVNLTQRALNSFLRWFFKHLYTTLAWAYDFIAWTSSIGQWDAWRATALQGLEQGPVLELGYGTGHLLVKLAQSGELTYGIDTSPQMRRLAAYRLARAHQPRNILQARAQALPFPAGAFSTVVSTFPSEYITHPETLLEARRVLAERGQFVIVGFTHITGRSLLDRCAALLYRITGQSAEPKEEWLLPLKRIGFDVRFDPVRLKRSLVVRVIAIKLPGMREL